MNIGDEVILNPKIESCSFYVILGQVEPMKQQWYKTWWETHMGQSAHVVHVFKDTIHIQFNGEPTTYIVGESYLKSKS